MTGAELNDSFISAMTTLCRFQHGCVVEQNGGMTTVFSHLPLASNYCIVSRPATSRAEFTTNVARASDYGRRSGVPWRFVMCADWLEDGLEQDLVGHGLTRVADVHAMWTDGLEPPRRSLPEMTFTPAIDAASLAPMVAINNAHHRLDPAAGASLYLAYVQVPHARALIGAVDGESVSCAGAVPIGDALYLGGVATRTEWRSRGYGETVLRQAIDESTAASGIGRVVLFALPRRVPFYQALGFTPSARLRVYLPDAEPGPAANPAP